MIYWLAYLIGAVVMAIIAVSWRLDQSWSRDMQAQGQTTGLFGKTLLIVVIALTWPYQVIALFAAVAVAIHRGLK